MIYLLKNDMADSNQSGVNTDNNQLISQNSNTRTDIFGGGQDVFDNLEKFERISNPVGGDDDFNFEFDELDVGKAVQDDKDNDVSHPDELILKNEPAGDGLGNTLDVAQLDDAGLNSHDLRTETIVEGVEQHQNQEEQGSFNPLEEEQIEKENDDIPVGGLTTESNNNADNMHSDGDIGIIEENHDAGINESNSVLGEEVVEKNNGGDVLSSDGNVTNQFEDVFNEPLNKKEVEDSEDAENVEEVEDSEEVEDEGLNQEEQEYHDMESDSLVDGGTVLMHQYRDLLLMAGNILKIEKKITKDDNFSAFEIIGNNTEKSTTRYIVSINDSEIPSLILKKIEKDYTREIEQEHVVEFTSESLGENLIVKVDSYQLYVENIDLGDPIKQLQVGDKMKKFVFLFKEKLSSLEEQLEEIRVQKEKMKAFRDVFRNF